MGPFVIGYDTMSYYIPTTLQWLNVGVNAHSFLQIAPLFYTIIMPPVMLGASLILVLKIIPVLLHGFLGLSIFAYAKKGLGWTPAKSLFTALIGTVYFVALRVSWDLLRNELALIFFFVALTALNSKQQTPRAWKNSVLAFLAMLAVVLAHQLVSVVMLGVIGLTILHRLIRKERGPAINLSIVFLPILIFFVFIYLIPISGMNSLDFSANFSWPLSDFFSYPSMIASEAGFFLYCYLPLLPLAIIGLKQNGNIQLRYWVAVTAVLLFIPIASLSNFRWVFLFTYPFAFFVSDALSWIKSRSFKKFKFPIYKAVLIYLVVMTSVLSFSYVLMPPEAPSPYFDPAVFNGYIYQVPSSMLQNTISIADCQDTANSITWFKNNIPGNALLLTHRAFYSWAMVTLNSSQILLYEYDDPLTTAENATQAGSGYVYLIWWTNGQGWYKQSTLPSNFQQVYSSGRIAIYNFSSTNTLPD